ncbi:unnamed protein product [Adineta steineri]|uniref:Uncharacterized protein n=1 Tax=Adineta steineri TaxID=433720 RepID=A0A815K5J8_9BILA|nr:unnamed protein product [Adineta steineri]
MSGNKCQPSASESYQSSARKRNIVLNIINNKLFFMSINLAEFYFGQHIEVGLESFSTTYATIATNAVSSCHFIFIDAELQEQQFLYLSHFSIECEVESCGSDTTLIEVTDQIVENINKYNETNEENQLLVDRININKILVGSGVDDIIKLECHPTSKVVRSRTRSVKNGVNRKSTGPNCKEEHLMKPPHRMKQQTVVEMAGYARKASPSIRPTTATTTTKKTSFCGWMSGCGYDY